MLLERELSQGVGSLNSVELRAVRNKGGLFRIMLEIILLDLFGISYDGGGEDYREMLGDEIPSFREGIPFLAAALHAVDIERHWDAEQARPESKDSIGGVAVERDGLAMKDQMNRREEGVRNGVEVLMTPGWKINERNAAISFVRMFLAAVNSDTIAACR